MPRRLPLRAPKFRTAQISPGAWSSIEASVTSGLDGVKRKQVTGALLEKAGVFSWPRIKTEGFSSACRKTRSNPRSPIRGSGAFSMADPRVAPWDFIFPPLRGWLKGLRSVCGSTVAILGRGLTWGDVRSHPRLRCVVPRGSLFCALTLYFRLHPITPKAAPGLICARPSEVWASCIRGPGGNFQRSSWLS